MAEYYVATNGNNGNPGTIGSPWRDIQYGYNQLSAGDILHIRGGTYTEGVLFFGSTGSSGNEYHVRAYNTGTPETVIIKNRLIIEADWQELRDLEFVTNTAADGWNDSEISVYSSNNSFLRMYCHDYDESLYYSGIMLGRSGAEYANNNTFLDTRLIWSGSIYFTDLRTDNNLFLGGEVAFSEGMSLRIGGSNNTVDGFALHDTGMVGLDGDAGDGVHFHGNGHSLKNCQLYRNFRWDAAQHCDAIQWWTNATNPTVNDILIENCRIGSTETGGYANEEDMGHIQWTAEDTSSDRVTVRNCVFLGTGYPYCFSSSSGQVVRGDDWVVTGNIFRCPENIRDITTAHDWIIRNNVFYSNGTDFTNFYDIDYNVYVNSKDSPDEGTHSHQQVSDPDFVDDDTGAGNDYGQSCDWHLEAGSICIDAGDSDAMPTLDPDGNSRYDDPLEANIGTGSGGAYWDIGIYEYQGVGGQIETLQGSSAGTSTAGARIVGTELLAGQADGTSTASANVYVPGIQEVAGQSDGSSSATASVSVFGVQEIAGQSDGVATVGASLQVTGGGGQLYATLEADNWLGAAAQSTNNGTSESLFVYRDVTDTDWCRLAVLRFHFTGIPDESVITVADLGLFAWDDPASGVTIYVRHLESTGQAFTELGSCWDTYNGSNVWDSGDFSAADWTTANQASAVSTGVDQHWMNWDIVDMVQHALDNHSKVLEIVVVTDANDNYFDFNAKDYEEDIPYLDITYTGGGPVYKELAGQSDGGSTAGLNLEKCVAFRYPESDDGETDGVFTYIPSSPETVWDKVDDPWDEWDGDATRVRHDSPDDSCYAGDSTAFAIPANATIVDLRIKIAHKKAQAGVAAIQTSIKVGGNWYDSSSVDPTLDTWTNQYTDYANNPDTSNPWTVDQINGVGANALDTFGWLCPDTDPDIHITQCVLRVRYTFAASTIETLAGTSDGTSTVSASLNVTSKIEGASDGLSTVAATADVTKELVGASAGTSTASADVELSNEKLLAGQANGVSTVTGVLKVTKPLGGQSDGGSTAIAERLEDASRNLADTSELFRAW